MSTHLKDLRPGSHIHLMGICGTAMASLAGLLKEGGFKVTGSDQNTYPPMSDQLAELNIPVFEGYRPQNLSPRPDLVVVGNVISRSNPEAEELIKLEIPFTSLPKAMGEFVIDGRKSLVVAGTHGKTTTTSLCAWFAENAHAKPGFLIGGIPKNFSHSFRPPSGDLFVIEGDEYDTAFFDKVPKFIHYRPTHVILTSVEFDHADIYKNLDEVKSAFLKLLKLIPANGQLVAFSDDENVSELLRLNPTSAPVTTFGWKSGDYRILPTEQSNFSLKGPGLNHEFHNPMLGRHNMQNAAAAILMGLKLNWQISDMHRALKSFLGVKRRQEILGEPNGMTVIEDFAHHPTAVRLTLEGIRARYADRRIVAIFEPRSATSRRNVFQKDYAASFSSADVVLISKPYDVSRIAEEERFSSELLVKDLEEKGKRAHLFDDGESLLKILKDLSMRGDVFVIMSNGGFGGIYPKLLSLLSSKS